MTKAKPSLTLVWRTDLHLADQNPRSRTDDWPTTLLDKVAQVGKIASKKKAKAVLDGGDFFHIKTPTRNSHSLVERVARVHQGYPCPVYSCIGNHDPKYGEYTYLDSSPMGVLMAAGVFRRLYDEHEALFKVSGLKVRVVGVPYHGVRYDMDRLTSITKGDEDFLVVVAHLLASPGGGEMFGGQDIISYGDLVGLDPDVWCFGHWHKNQGITEIAPGTHVVNTGSLSRGALAEDDLKRIPCCVVMKFQGGKVTFEEVPLKVKPAEEIFDIERRVREESREATMDAFMDSLQEVLKPQGEEESLLDTVRAMPDLEDTVKERSCHYLEQAGSV